MHGKLMSLTLFVIMMISVFIPVALAHNAPFPSYDPTGIIVDTTGEPETVDPAWGYDTASGEVIFNVYETLAYYDNIYTDGPYTSGKAANFKPTLATDYCFLPGPAPYANTFYAEIRGTDYYEGIDTFVARNAPVNLYKDGGTYQYRVFVCDPDLGTAGSTPGQYPNLPLKNSYDPTTSNNIVDRANVAARPYGGTGSVIDTTWDEITDRDWNDVDIQETRSYYEGLVLHELYKDVAPTGLSPGDIIKFVEKSDYWNLPGAVNFCNNVPVYFEVLTTNAGPPFTMTAHALRVFFHDGNPLTPADVEYSFERWMVQDRSGGPQWMFYYPVFNEYGAVDPVADPDFATLINNHIESNTTDIIIHMDNNFPMQTFMQILCKPYASVVEKAWAISLGDFDGNWAHGWQYIWDTWHNPSTSFIEDLMMGTGPYKLDYWNHGTAYSIVRNPDYWDGWPASGNRYTCNTRRPTNSYAERVTWNLITAWTTRRARFLGGESDYTTVPRQYRDQVLGQIVGGEPIRCFYPVEPQISVDAAFFNFNIDTGSPYMGTPGGLPPGTFAQTGIPPDIFSDKHVRAGFRYAFDFATYLSAAYLGEATQPADPIIPGLSYDNVANALPVFDLTKAAQELQAAWGGALWNNGMKFTLVFNSGNVAREIAMTLLANNINSLNSKFHLDTAEIAWGSGYLPRMVASQLPLFSMGWQADYSDPDNFAFPFMHTFGSFAHWQGYSNPRVDELIQAGVLMPSDAAVYSGQLDLPDLASLIAAFNNYPNIPPDTRWPRRSIYYELQALYNEDVPGFALSQEVGRHFEQAWMRGWDYNPLYGGCRAHDCEDPGFNAYHRMKAMTHFGDVNSDGTVDVADGSVISAHWTKPSPDSLVGPLGYCICADINGGTGATPGGGTGLVPGIADGRVSIADASIVSAYWDGPPQGPSHP